MYQYKNGLNNEVSVYQIIEFVIGDGGKNDIRQGQSYVPRCAVAPRISTDILELDMERGRDVPYRGMPDAGMNS